ARGVHLLEDDRGRREAEAGAAVLLRDERGQPAVLGQRADELLGVAVGLEPAPVLVGKAPAELADRGPDLTQLLRDREVHRRSLWPGTCRKLRESRGIPTAALTFYHLQPVIPGGEKRSPVVCN